MDSIGKIFGGGGGGGGITDWLGLGLGGFGVLNNILSGIKQRQALQGAVTQQQTTANLLNNPALIAQKVAAASQPLDQSLVQDITNQVQAQGAERGWATSPNIMQAVLGQTLAPYKLNEQQIAAQMISRVMGLPFDQSLQLADAFSKSGSDTTAFWQMLQQGQNPEDQSVIYDPYGLVTGSPNFRTPGGGGGGDVPAPPMTTPDPYAFPGSIPSLTPPTAAPDYPWDYGTQGT